MKVVNVRNTAEKTKCSALYVYCGRPSVLGNPFVVNTQALDRDAERNRCVDAYGKWIRTSNTPKADAAREAIARLNKDSILGCFCAPKRCHCDEIVAYRKELEGESWVGNEIENAKKKCGCMVVDGVCGCEL